jgi:hypothetical protein
VLLAGCNGQNATRLKLTQQMTQVTKETADLLATVTDKASATTAAPQMRLLTKRLLDLSERFDAFATEDDSFLSDGDQTLLAEHSKWIGEHVRLMQELQRIGANPEASEPLGEAWRELTGGMYDLGGPLAAGGQMDLGTTRQLGPGGALPAEK